MTNEPWKKSDCIHYYEYYTFRSWGLHLEPCCNNHNFNCVDCEEYEKGGMDD